MIEKLPFTDNSWVTVKVAILTQGVLKLAILLILTQTFNKEIKGKKLFAHFSQNTYSSIFFIFSSNIALWVTALGVKKVEIPHFSKQGKT